MDFQGFPKIPRLNRECVVTEKIDGTNAQVVLDYGGLKDQGVPVIALVDDFTIYAGSRNRWIYPGKEDNAGFAQWVRENALEIAKLGEGQHFGEWWGQGIQRRYGLNEKRFSLFNTHRWSEAYQAMLAGHENNFPKCCHVVPVLYQGPFSQGDIAFQVNELKYGGSKAAPGFMDPEGVIVYHEASKGMFKVTCKDDEKAKGQVNG